MPDLSEVLKSALSLKLDDRAALAERLLASLDDLGEEEAERAWAEEARRRLVEYHTGRAASVQGQDVANKAERLFRWAMKVEEKCSQEGLEIWKAFVAALLAEVRILSGSEGKQFRSSKPDRTEGYRRLLPRVAQRLGMDSDSRFRGNDPGHPAVARTLHGGSAPWGST